MPATIQPKPNATMEAVTMSCCPGPGCCLDGTVWDYTNLGCVVATPTDVDLDGCTGVGDVLEVLATFGQWYDDSENEEDGIGGE